MNHNKINRICAYIDFQNVVIKTSQKVPMCGFLFFSKQYISAQKKVNQNPFHVTKALVMNESCINLALVNLGLVKAQNKEIKVVHSSFAYLTLEDYTVLGKNRLTFKF